MSDSVSKWYDMQEDLEQVRVYKPYFKKLVNRIVSEGHKKQAYNILVEYPEEAILEAARILKSGE